MFSVKKKKRKKVLFPDHFVLCFLFHLIPIYQSSALIRVSMALIKCHDQNTNWGGKNILVYTYLAVHHCRSQDRDPNRARTWKWEIFQRIRSDAAYLLASQDLPSPLSHRTQPRYGTVGWDLLQQSLIKKVP